MMEERDSQSRLSREKPKSKHDHPNTTTNKLPEARTRIKNECGECRNSGVK
jgi:hypothetical protein